MRTLLLSLSLLVALSALTPTDANDGVVIRLPARVNFTTARDLLNLKNANGTSLGHIAGVAHYGLDVDVDIGTPAKTFHLVVDTYDGDSWLVGNPDFSDIAELYNASESSTATDLELSFTDGPDYFRVDGSLFADVINIGQSLQVNQSFGVAESMDDTIANSLSDYEVDGVLGLAAEILTPNGVPSLLQSLVSTNNITMTTVWIESWSKNSINPGDPKSTLNASITFGGLDSEHCNPDGWVSTKWSSPHWALNVESMALSTGEKQAVDTEAYLMAGQLLSMIPKQHADFIASSVDATPFGDYWYSVPCDQITRGPTIELSINSEPGEPPVKRELAPEDYILQMRKDVCILVFTTSHDETQKIPNWYLSGPVFNRYCVAIDTQQGEIKFTESLK